MLIGAVALAFIVLGVVVVFNGVLYTETLSSSDTGQTASSAEATELEVRQGIACLAAEYDDDSALGSDDKTALRNEIQTYAELHRNSTVHSQPAAVNVTPDSGSPFDELFAEDGGATVTITYDSTDLSYERTIDVPTNECPRGPTVEQFEVTPSLLDNDSTQYSVYWNVSGSDLSNLTITLVEDSGETEKSPNVSGTREDGLTSFYSDSSVRYIEIVVADDDVKTDDERRYP